MRYKTIRGRKFYHHLFDFDTGKAYSVVNADSHRTYGYFQIREVEHGMWKIERSCRAREVQEDEHMTPDTQFRKIQLLQFLYENYGTYKSIQNYINYLSSKF